MGREQHENSKLRVGWEAKLPTSHSGDQSIQVAICHRIKPYLDSLSPRLQDKFAKNPG